MTSNAPGPYHRVCEILFGWGKAAFGSQLPLLGLSFLGFAKKRGGGMAGCKFTSRAPTELS